MIHQYRLFVGYWADSSVNCYVPFLKDFLTVGYPDEEYGNGHKKQL